MNTIILRITATLWADIRRHLTSDPDKEQCVILLASRANFGDGGYLYTVKGVLVPKAGDLDIQTAGHIQPSRKFQGLAYHLAAKGRLSIIDVHTHTDAGQPHFSGIDDFYARQNAEYMAERFFPSHRMGMVVMNRDATAFQGRVYNPMTRLFEPTKGIEILGSPTSFLGEESKLKPGELALYSRHTLIPGWRQERLANIRVALVGLGGTGALVLQGLVGMGVGRRAGIIICDHGQG